MDAETLGPALDLWFGIHRPSVAALVESLAISCRAEDVWLAADTLIGTHPGGLTALDAMIGNSPSASPPLRQNQVRRQRVSFGFIVIGNFGLLRADTHPACCHPHTSVPIATWHAAPPLQSTVNHRVPPRAPHLDHHCDGLVPSPLLRTQYVHDTWSVNDGLARRCLSEDSRVLLATSTPAPENFEAMRLHAWRWPSPVCVLRARRCGWAGGGWTRTWSPWAGGSTCSPAARRARTCARRTTWSCSGSAKSASPSRCTPQRCGQGLSRRSRCRRSCHLCPCCTAKLPLVDMQRLA